MDAELRRQMALCRECYLRHEYDRAEPLLREVIAQHPGSAEMFNMLGVILHHKDHFAEAREMFAQALHLNPAYTEAALNLAVVFGDMGQYQEAQRAYKQAMAQTQGQPQFLDQYARGKLANMHAATAEAYRELGLRQEAIAELSRALKLCPTFADLHCQLAMVLSETGDREQALSHYAEALVHNPGYVQACIQLGAELYALGRRDEARAAWERALQMEPDNRRLPVYLKLVGAPAT